VAEIPFFLPSKFQLIVSLKTAKTIRLELPATLIACADEVID
jgi:putative ABC transport system substrate-binding protein